MKISYNWLKSYVPEIPEAEKLADVFTYHLAEVESLEKLSDGDFLFDINILPNRAHDLLSHQGIARELASLLNISYKLPEYKLPVFLDKESSTKVSIKLHNDKCRRYIACIVRGVKVGPSPEWIVTYLESVGQRSINNIVDATNIVMYDCGQPTHAFDLKSVMHNGEVDIEIKDANEGDILKLVGREGITVNLLPSDLVITSGGKIISLAAKGGADSGVNESTTDLLLEIDNFEPTNVRKTMRRLGIFTDAGKRFENDLSPELCGFAIHELCALLLEFFPDATFEYIVGIYPQQQEVRKLSFSVKRISSILGVNVSIDEIKNILDRYLFEYKNEGDIFEIVVPMMRLDLVIEEDMAEEIGRILGYDKVIGEIPKVDFIPKENETHKKILWARNDLLARGYNEVMTYSFASKGEVEVMASASDKKFLRTNLSDGLKESLKLNKANMPLLGLSEIKIFEIGTVFKNGKEEINVAFAHNAKDVSEMSLEEFCHTVDLNVSLEYKNSLSENLKFKPWSVFPFIARDIALWVPENVSKDEVLKVIKENMGDMVVRGPELFDEFKKDGKISYAFRLVFQSYDKTLTDEEVNNVMNKITDKIKENIDWQVR